MTLPRRREYEVAVILSPEATEAEAEEIVGRITDFISERNGDVSSQDNWGVKRLAYPIQRFIEGNYFIIRCTMEAQAAVELNKMLNAEQGVLRYLVVRLDKSDIIAMENQAAAEREAREREVADAEVPEGEPEERMVAEPETEELEAEEPEVSEREPEDRVIAEPESEEREVAEAEVPEREPEDRVVAEPESGELEAEEPELPEPEPKDRVIAEPETEEREATEREREAVEPEAEDSFAMIFFEAMTPTPADAPDNLVAFPIGGPNTEESAITDSQESGQYGRSGSQVTKTVTRWEPTDAAKGLTDRFRNMVEGDYTKRCQICGNTFMKPDGELQAFVIYIVSPSTDFRTNNFGNLLSLCGWHYALVQYGKWTWLDPETDRPFTEWGILRAFVLGASEDMDDMGNPYFAVPVRFFNVYQGWNPEPDTIDGEIRYTVPHWMYLRELLIT